MACHSGRQNPQNHSDRISRGKSGTNPEARPRTPDPFFLRFVIPGKSGIRITARDSRQHGTTCEPVLKGEPKAVVGVLNPTALSVLQNTSEDGARCVGINAGQRPTTSVPIAQQGSQLSFSLPLQATPETHEGCERLTSDHLEFRRQPE